MAVEIRKVYVIEPDSHCDERYIFEGLTQADAEEMCLALVEDLLDDEIQITQCSYYNGTEDIYCPDWWVSMTEGERLNDFNPYLYELPLYSFK